MPWKSSMTCSTCWLTDHGRFDDFVSIQDSTSVLKTTTRYPCITNKTFLIWNFVPPLVNSQGISIPQDWFVTSTDLSQQLQQLTVNSTNFTVLRTSERNGSPLVFTLTIIHSNSAMDMIGTRCAEIMGTERATAVSSTIQVISDWKIGRIDQLIHVWLHSYNMGSLSYSGVLIGPANINVIRLKLPTSDRVWWWRSESAQKVTVYVYMCLWRQTNRLK